jgi:hypothetical protein
MKRIVNVTIAVEVEVDEAKFTPQFMAEFRESFYQFADVERHVLHIGQLAAREMLRQDFTEGYGPLADFGIRARIVDQDQEIVGS